MIAQLESPAEIAKENPRVLAVSAVIALALLVGTSQALQLHKRARAPVAADVAPIEAELYQEKPMPAHLVAKATAIPQPVSKEKAISPDVDKGTTHKGPSAPQAVENQMTGSQAEVPTHGPVLISSETPKLPSYLKDQNLKATVLIEFTVATSGEVTPHLLRTSGNEELDALALKAARTWKFSPAREAGNPVDSKVRLKINFEVQ